MRSLDIVDFINELSSTKNINHSDVMYFIERNIKPIPSLIRCEIDGKKIQYYNLTEEQYSELCEKLKKNWSMKKYYNYHKHSYYSNVSTYDCVVSYDEYCKRSKELGHEWLSSCEHGGVFAWIETYNKAKENKLKFIHGGEFYFVPNRFEENNANYHLILQAKTYNAMRELNYIMSEAYDTGFYYKARVDLELLKMLPKGEVFCTSACLAGVLRYYPKTKPILEELIDIFGKDNFFLEVQCHPIQKQVEYNKLMKQLSKEYGLRLIAGVDSHMIDDKDGTLRDYLLHSKGIIYEDEIGWINSYPDYETLKNNFLNQGIWTEEEVEEFIDNTLILTQTDNIVIDTKMKVPSAFPNKSREWKLSHLKELIFKKWDEYKYSVDKDRWKLYVDELIAEYSVIEETKMEDYFLLNYYIIKRGVELGGILTKSSRGCFYPNSRVLTTDGYKEIKDMKIGDTVINRLGQFDTVVDVLRYDIEESMTKIHSIGNKDIILTNDHRVYVYDSTEDTFKYKHAKDIIPNKDFLTTPINMPPEKNTVSKYDLANYSDLFYDDNYIYDSKKGSNYLKTDILSPSYMCKNNIAGTMTNWKYRKGYLDENSEGYKKIYNHVKMKPNEYSFYVDNILHTHKVNRYIENDSELMFFIGFVLGDGHIKKDNKDGVIYLYLQNTGKKDNIAKPRLINFLNRYNIPHTVKKTNKDMITIYVFSRAFLSFIVEEYKIYDEHRTKYLDIENIITNNSKNNLKGLFEGLLYSDGSFRKEKDCRTYQYNFDNTSMYLVSLFNILSYIIKEAPTRRSYDYRHKHVSVKSTICRRSFFTKGNYICSKIFSVEPTDTYKGYVYDLTIQNDPSFIVENSIVHNSGASYLINFMLGFTSIDRLKHKIPMLRERFMGKARIIDNNSAPDID